jgi:branched-chain amino acid transport system permease protein
VSEFATSKRESSLPVRSPVRGEFRHRGRAVTTRASSTLTRFSMQLVGALVVVLVGVRLEPYQLGIANAILLTAFGALGLNLLMGVAGQVSAGNGAFLGIGAIGAAILGPSGSIPFPVVIIFAAALGGCVGLLVGIPALSLVGIYLTFGTIALNYIVFFAFDTFQTDTVGGGGWVLPTPSIAGFQLSSPLRWYFFLIVLLGIVWLLFRNMLGRSPFGRAWHTVRSNELVANSLGINVARYKVLAFVISSAVIAMAGALASYNGGLIFSSNFDSLSIAISYISMVVIGGWGSMWGAVVGAAIITLLPYLMSAIGNTLAGANSTFISSQANNLQVIVNGLIIIGILLFQPGGLTAIVGQVRRHLQAWPFRELIDWERELC